MENEALVLDLLDWIGAAPRQYGAVMEVWRTSCPRLTIWEDALDAGYVAVNDRDVALTDAGRRFLETKRFSDAG